MSPPTAPAVPLAPGWELWTLFWLNGFYLLTDAALGPPFYPTANVAGPLALIAVLLFSAARSVQANADNIWTTLFWFRISTAVYFGFGSLVPIIANTTTRHYLDTFFPASTDQLFELNLLISASSFTVIAAARSTFAVMTAVRARRLNQDGALLFVALMFAAIGFADKIFVVIPYSMGYFGNHVVNSILLTIGTLASVSLCLLTRYAMLYDRRYLLLVFAGLGFEIVVGLLEFNKTDVITATLMFFLGYVSAGAATRRALISGIGLALVLASVVPIVEYSRVASEQKYGRAFTGELTQRLEIIVSYFAEMRELPLDEQIESTYVRLSYTNAATFAMSLHDTGYPATTLRNSWTLPIPRALWNGKPTITDVGLDFNELAVGSRTSSSAPGLFADGYWNFGWLSLLYVMGPMGALFALLSRYTLAILTEARWLQFPAVLLALRMGFRVDGFIITDVLGPIFIFLGASTFLALIESGHARRIGSMPVRRPVVSTRQMRNARR